MSTPSENTPAPGSWIKEQEEKFLARRRGFNIPVLPPEDMEYARRWAAKRDHDIAFGRPGLFVAPFKMRIEREWMAGSDPFDIKEKPVPYLVTRVYSFPWWKRVLVRFGFRIKMMDLEPIHQVTTYERMRTADNFPDMVERLSKYYEETFKKEENEKLSPGSPRE